MHLMLYCVTYLIAESQVEIEQNWGTNSDEDRRLLGATSPLKCVALFEERMALTNRYGLNSTFSGASHFIPRTNP